MVNMWRQGLDKLVERKTHDVSMHDMKVYGNVDFLTLSALVSALNGGEKPASRPTRFNPLTLYEWVKTKFLRLLRIEIGSVGFSSHNTVVTMPSKCPVSLKLHDTGKCS